MVHPCELVAAMVVSDIKERLSPKKAPPTTTAVVSAILPCVDEARPTAIGTSATMVPTLVPIDRLMKHVARKSPGNTIFSGSTDSINPTVASTDPMALAALANAPAKTNIQSISIILFVLAPRLKMSIDSRRFLPLVRLTAYMLDNKKATLIGVL